MPAGEIHQFDYGTQFQLTVRDQDNNTVDLSTATVKQITFQKSDQTTITKNLGCLNNCSDGIVIYTTVSGDINLAGIWAFQCYFSTPSGTFFSDLTRFPVLENLYVGNLP